MRNSRQCRYCNANSRTIPTGACEKCSALFCDKHKAWDTGDLRWLCAKCARELGIKAPRV